MWVIIGAAAVAVVVIAVVLVTLRRGFTRQHADVEASWRLIHVELLRRQDMVGRLIAVVGDQHDLDRLIQSRAHAVAARGAGPLVQGQAEQRLTTALTVFFAEAGSRPDLQSHNDFRFLRWQLTEGEHRLAAARDAYNQVADRYNACFTTFPTRLLKGTHLQAQPFTLPTP
jgi:LemA protein